jgi:hypothetical protein
MATIYRGVSRSPLAATTWLAAALSVYCQIIDVIGAPPRTTSYQVLLSQRHESVGDIKSTRTPNLLHIRFKNTLNWHLF